MKLVDYRQLMHDIHKRPQMYGIDGSLGEYIAYLCGMDKGSDGQALAGFRERLADRWGKGNNLGWPGLVYTIAFDEYPASFEAVSFALKDPAFQQHAIETLFRLLDEFFAQQLSE